jgi:hypothetical protein
MTPTTKAIALPPGTIGATTVVFVLVVVVRIVEEDTVELVTRVVDVDTVETTVVVKVPVTTGEDNRSIAESSGTGGLGYGGLVDDVKERLEPTIHPLPGEVK